MNPHEQLHESTQRFLEHVQKKTALLEKHKMHSLFNNESRHSLLAIQSHLNYSDRKMVEEYPEIIDAVKINQARCESIYDELQLALNAEDQALSEALQITGQYFGKIAATACQAECKEGLTLTACRQILEHHYRMTQDYRAQKLDGLDVPINMAAASLFIDDRSLMSSFLSAFADSELPQAVGQDTLPVILRLCIKKWSDECPSVLDPEDDRSDTEPPRP